MFTKPTIPTAIIAIFVAAPAHADVNFNGPGLVLQGISLNGLKVNGITFNGPGVVLQGPELNGMRVNGPVFQGTRFNGTKFNGPGLVLQGPGLNVGGHHGVGLNGRVIAIEF